MTTTATQPAPRGIALAPSLVARLRAETREDHARVDDAFGAFDLGRPDGYRAFLAAHARVLPAVEDWLDAAELVPGWRGRSAALRRDLAALDMPIPDPSGFACDGGEAARWGALYVIEGSRLGGAVLAKRVPPGWPAAYLNMVHGAGEWRHLLATIDRLVLPREAERAAIAGARAVFAAFLRAAEGASGSRPPP